MQAAPSAPSGKEQAGAGPARGGPFGFRWVRQESGPKPGASRDAKAQAKDEQAKKPVADRTPVVSAVNMDIVSQSAGAAWTFVGLLARLPLEIILAGTAATQSLSMSQVILAKVEDVRSRRKAAQGKSNEEGK